MVCPNCGRVLPEIASFCDNCGTVASSRAPATSGLSPLAVSAFPSPYPHTGPVLATSAGLVEEGRGKRVVGFLIDLIPALLLALLNFLPFIGWMFHGLLSALYWLLRDVGGASLGKIAMSSVVYSQDGRPANTGQRILRNVPLAIPGILGVIPFVGVGLHVFALLLFVAEMFALLLTGRRIGDRLAGTTVVRKQAY